MIEHQGSNKEWKSILRGRGLKRKLLGSEHLVIKNIQSILDKLDYDIICGLYYPMSHEPSILSLLQFNKHNTNYAFPKIENEEIKYIKVNEQTKFRGNETNNVVLEPEGGMEVVPDVIIVPGVAFDMRGYRLGMGKGHFDKYLAKNKVKVRIGVFFSSGIHNYLPSESRDCRMNFIVTDKWILSLDEFL